MARGPLGVTRADKSPVIPRPRPGTLDFALRSVRAGKYRAMELAPRAIAFEPRMEQVVSAWVRLTRWQQRITPLEDLCAAAGMTPSEFLGAVVRASFELTNEMTDLLVAAAFPEIVQATVQRARTPRGVEDRRMLFEHIGFLGGSGT
jgi:hypothetical protein